MLAVICVYRAHLPPGAELAATGSVRGAGVFCLERSYNNSQTLGLQDIKAKFFIFGQSSKERKLTEFRIVQKRKNLFPVWKQV